MLSKIPFEYTSLSVEYADIMKEISVHLVEEIEGFDNMPFLSFKEIEALKRVVKRARDTFEDIDDDHNGYLEGDELVAVASKVWT